MKKKSGYLPGLDGWRALAILGVLMTHDHAWTLFGHSTERVKGYGGWGVFLFFAISGFLICTRILEDERWIGHFDIKAFYIRRICRIQPAALTYLAAIATLILLGVIHEHWSAWVGAVFLYTNFLYNTSDTMASGHLVGHFWTLAVEEHFYILLSCLLFFVRRKRIAVFLTLLVCILLVQQYALTHKYFDDAVSTRRTYWVIQLLLFPSLLALLLQKHRCKALCIRFLHPWVAYVGTAVAMLLWGAREHGLRHAGFAIRHPATVAGTILYGFSFWVIATSFHPGSLSTRFLELRPLRFLGRLSYSVYLWHVLFFIARDPAMGVTWQPLLFASERPWKYIFTFVAACLSYYFIERPMIRRGHALAPPATPGHKNLDPAVV